MPRRTEPHDAIKQRLDEWAEYVRSTGPHLGWNVSPSSFSDDPGYYQKRNDAHSNPVEAEYTKMWRHQREALTTGSAIRELPRLMRKCVEARHYKWPEASIGYIAEQIGSKQPHVSRALKAAYERLERELIGIEVYQRRELKVALGGMVYPA